MLFEPKAEEAAWKKLHRELDSMSVGDVLTYARMCELTGAKLEIARGHLARAVRELEEQKLRTVTNVRLEGYRIVEAREHERLARGHQRRAKRQVTKARRKVQYVRRDELDDEQRRRVDALEHNYGQQELMLQRLDARVNGVELRQKRVEKSSEHVSERIGAIEEALRARGLLERAEQDTA